MPIRLRQHLLSLSAVVALLTGCKNPPNPIVTLVGKSVGTLELTAGNNYGAPACNPNPTPPAPDVMAMWNGLSPTEKLFPFAGFQLWRNTDPGCSSSRLDVYRAFATFNMASVSTLKGLVTKAELVVATRALPAGAGSIVTLGTVNASCPTALGGGGTVQRFGPNNTANLPPITPAGTITMLPFNSTTPLPTGNVVYTFPPSFPTGSAGGPVAGAANPTTLSRTGTGGSVFTTDVTSQVNAALNGGFAGMTWMITSAFEGPFTVPVPAGSMIDCRTPYDIQLRLTHY